MSYSRHDSHLDSEARVVRVETVSGRDAPMLPSAPEVVLYLVDVGLIIGLGLLINTFM